MARLIKTHQFAIFEDADIPILDVGTTEQRLLDDVSTIEAKIQTAAEELEDARDLITSDEYTLHELEDGQKHGNDNNGANDERRLSGLTTVSISSLPESCYESDDEPSEQRQHPYTPPVIRPRFPQIESIKRLQGNSAPQFGSRNSRRSLTSKSRPLKRTPRSARYNNAIRIPKPRRRISEQTEAPDEEHGHYPLVLLHATLLPVDLPWSTESMQELLPAQLLDNLRLLKAKVSENVRDRGILISHPGEEYELLEERLLEALELKDERITKCGHFHRRDSSNSASGSDSGVGSSVDGSEGEMCNTCQHRIKFSRAPIGDSNKKWSVKIFAANGLMRASAWAAAWQDMESVDVEIVPWISEDLRRQLDKRREQEEAFQEAVRRDDEDAKIRQMVEDEVRLAFEIQRSRREAESGMAREHEPTEPYKQDVSMEETDAEEVTFQTFEDPLQLQAPQDLPQIYPPSEIPLSILLKNYVYLLAQDWRNVAIFLLGTTALVWALLHTVTASGSILARYHDEGTQLLPSTPLPASSSPVYTAPVEPQSDEVMEANESTVMMASPDPMLPMPITSDEIESLETLDETCTTEGMELRSIFDTMLSDFICPAGSQGSFLDKETEILT